MVELGPQVLQEQGKVAVWPEFPWLTILVQPRKTIRAIVDVDQDRYTILLVILYGVTSGVASLIDESYGDAVFWPVALILAAILGPVGALISWGIGGALFRWTGGLFGGVATSKEVRAAMAWSAVPYIASLAVWLPLLLLYGPELFYSADTPKIDQNPFPLLIGGGLVFIFDLWWYFLFWKCFAEVQRLSLIKSLAAILIPGVVIFAVLVGCGMLMQVDKF